MNLSKHPEENCKRSSPPDAYGWTQDAEQFLKAITIDTTVRQRAHRVTDPVGVSLTGSDRRKNIHLTTVIAPLSCLESSSRCSGGHVPPYSVSYGDFLQVRRRLTLLMM